MRTVALHAGESVVAVGLAEAVAEHLDFRDIFPYLVIDTLGHVGGNALGRTDRKLDRDVESSHIHVREILCLESRAEGSDYQHEDADSTGEDNLLVSHTPGDKAAVAGSDLVETLVDRGEYGDVDLSGLRTGLEELGAEHRHEGKSRRGRYYHDYADDETELTEEDSGHS